MDTLDWAKEEVRLACLKENPDIKLDENGYPTEFDYGCSCYGSALNAFESLCNDGHSGFSFGMTVQILNKLCKGFPLTPIEDVPEVWNNISFMNEKNYKLYQCKRDASLFKYVYEDGRVEYSDVDRIKCVDPTTGLISHFGFVQNIINEMYPLEMPYMPTGSYMVSVVSFLFENKEGNDFDTIGISTVLTPDKETVRINRYFREPNGGEEPDRDGWKEITKDEFMTRYTGRAKREDE